MIRVLLVDDQSLLRMGFRLILEAEPDIEVVGEAGDGAAGVSMTSALHPDVVLMDVRMPGRDGPATLAALREQDPQVRCCFMSGDLGEHTEDELRKLGTGEVLQKPFTVAEAGRVLRDEIGRRETEVATQDDHWRDDGGQGERPAP